VFSQSIELVPGHREPAASAGVDCHYVRGVFVAVNVGVAGRPCFVMDHGSNRVVDDEVVPASPGEMDSDALGVGLYRISLA